MRKIISICILLLTAFTLTACDKQEQSTTTVPSEPITLQSNIVVVTFPEGYSCVQIAEKLEKNEVCKAADFMAEMSNVEYYASRFDFVADIDNTEFRAFDLEGYIFPDTYEFYINEGITSVVSRFLTNFKSRVTPEMYDRAQKLGYTMDEMISLASVIQKEAGKVEEMHKVSSILHNRITGVGYGKFQCDVTINYVNDYITDSPYLEGDTSIYNEHYNTYKCLGIQVGAICNPGLEAINAALYPDDTNYYFFVTDKQWNYYYSETYEEHQKNCKAVGIIDA